MNASHKILIVDDEHSHRLMLEAVLSAEGYLIEQASSGEEALHRVESGRMQGGEGNHKNNPLDDHKDQQTSPFDLVIMDIKMGRLDGFQAMKAMRKTAHAMPIILMTAYGTINAAVEAMKAGAEDYITKPIDIDALKEVVKKALHGKPDPGVDKEDSRHHSTADTSLKCPSHKPGHPPDHPSSFTPPGLANHSPDATVRSDLDPVFKDIIGNSAPMLQIFDLVCRAAPTDATILILGESGTGKELIAQAIHRLSLRKEGPYIPVNCASLPESLLESELFGHEKGAFTGAVKKHPGKFQAADKGTIFLDEIGEMPVALQVKLLRVLQERQFEPLGSTKTSKVDIRVVAATHRMLEDAIKQGNFREDLFYRLNVLTIALPPLRERQSDIPPLAHFFLGKYADRNQRRFTGFDADAMERLTTYHWPGNIRELENCIERAVILSRNVHITLDDLPPSILNPNGPPAFSPQAHATAHTERGAHQEKSLKEMEKEMILRTIEETGDNRTQSAKILGISRRTLQLKLKEYGVNP